jgi:hypothetical protein
MKNLEDDDARHQRWVWRERREAEVAEKKLTALEESERRHQQATGWGGGGSFHRPRPRIMQRLAMNER